MDDANPNVTVEDTPLVVAGRTFNSRLIIGTGKYATYAQNAEALKASGADTLLPAGNDRSSPLTVSCSTASLTSL